MLKYYIEEVFFFFITLQNEYGTITVEDEVIAKLAGLTAMECYGIVGMAAKNVKEGIFRLLKKESLTKGIMLNTENNKVSLDFHIIVEYGTNIPAIAENAISAVRYKLEESLNIEAEEINVFVEGIRIDV